MTVLCLMVVVLLVEVLSLFVVVMLVVIAVLVVVVVVPSPPRGISIPWKNSPFCQTPTLHCVVITFKRNLAL